MKEENLSSLSFNELTDSLDEVIDSLFIDDKKEERKEEKKANKIEIETEIWELLPKDKVTAKVKCFLKSEGTEVEVDVSFKIDSIDGNKITLSSPSFVFVWKCLEKGKDILLLSKDGNYLLKGKVEEINLRKETLVVSLYGEAIRYPRQLFRVEVNPKEPIYIVMKIENKPVVAVVKDINEEACSFVYTPLPLLPGDVFGAVLRFPDGKKIAIPNAEVLTVRRINDGLRLYVIKIKVNEAERAYLRKFLIERQREILRKLREL